MILMEKSYTTLINPIKILKKNRMGVVGKRTPASFGRPPCVRGLWGAHAPNICIEIRTVPAGTSSACEVTVRGCRVLLFNCLPDVCFFDDVGCKREP